MRGSQGQTRDEQQVEVDWTAVIEHFCRQHEMSGREALKWVAHRTSLQVACEVFGVSLSQSVAARYTSNDARMLTDLGDLVWAAGYAVPRLMEHHRLEYKPREMRRVGFSLSKDEYLLERAAGKSKNRIAHDQGISGPALFHWLDKWGLKDAAVEAAAIEELTGRTRLAAVERPYTEAPAPTTALPAMTPQETRTGAQGESFSLHPAVQLTNAATGHEGSFSAARIARDVLVAVSLDRESATFSHLISRFRNRDVMETSAGRENGSDSGHCATATELADAGAKRKVEVCFGSANMTAVADATGDSAPAGAKGNGRIDTRSVSAGMSRDEAMQSGLALLLGAVGQAYQDLSALLGEQVASEQIQHYVDHQVERFLADREPSHEE